MDRRVQRMVDANGRDLSGADRQFVNILMKELEQFQYQAPKDRALMFHPLNGYQRYLIHKVTELFPKLASFTIHGGKKSRTVVCFKSKRREQQIQLGQIPDQRSPSKGMSVKELKGPQGDAKSKTLGHSSARGRLQNDDPPLKSKMGRYNTLSNDAVRKRERGLNLEGPVVNGDYSRSDIEDTRRKSHPDSKQKHRTKRSHSQPHLNDMPRSRHRRDSIDDAIDIPNSDAENSSRKSHRAMSANNTPEKKRSKSRPKAPLSAERTEPVISRHNVDDIQTYSGTEFSHQDGYSTSDNDEDEIPPSYEKTSREATNKAKRNLMRIKRTNSTRSCPPLDQRKHDYVNSEAALLKSDKHISGYQESPVFPRKSSNSQPRLKSKHVPTDKKPRESSKKSKRNRDAKTPEPSREYVNLPTEIERQHSYESSPFESPWLTDPELNQEAVKEIAAVIEKVPSVNKFVETQVVPIDKTQSPSHPEGKETVKSVSAEVPTCSTRNVVVPSVNKETQTDLHGSVVDIMVSAYSTPSQILHQIGAHSGHATNSVNPPPSTQPSGTSTPSLSSPASAYEKLGEYMLKAMLNFQSMLVDGQLPPNSQDFRPTMGPESYRSTPPVYPNMPHPTQPIFVPWMPPFYPDPMAARPPVMTYQSQPSAADSCCSHHQPVNGSRKKVDSFTSNSSRDDGIHHHRPHGHRFRKSSGKVLERTGSGNHLHSSKGLQAFDSDTSSEVTNPEITVAKGGDGVVVYVSNSNHSSAAGSVVDGSNGLPLVNGDERASPLGHDNDEIFKKLSKLKSPNGSDSKKKNTAEKIHDDGLKKPGEKLKKSDKLSSTKENVISVEEITPLSVKAPLAMMDDEYDISHSSSSASSSSSRRSSFYGRASNSPDADGARSLVGEDLGPLVCFDDNLEMACEDGTTED